MSAISTTRKSNESSGGRDCDPRVVRSTAAALDAARTLFLKQGYAGTTMDEIAAAAGLVKRTLYNNYPDKETLFVEMVGQLTKFADDFVSDLRERLGTATDGESVVPMLYELGERLALGIVRPEVVAIRCLLIGESRTFPGLAKDYFDAAPGQVISELSEGLRRLGANGALSIKDPRRAAAQFAYLIAGEHLDRSMLVGTVPSKAKIVACARDGVETFLARYASIRKLDLKRGGRPKARY